MPVTKSCKLLIFSSFNLAIWMDRSLNKTAILWALLVIGITGIVVQRDFLLTVLQAEQTIKRSPNTLSRKFEIFKVTLAI